jgi:hypothetical protein
MPSSAVRPLLVALQAGRKVWGNLEKKGKTSTLKELENILHEMKNILQSRVAILLEMPATGPGASRLANGLYCDQLRN